jgi:hypothetical protein
MQINVQPWWNNSKHSFLFNKRKKRKYVQFTALSVRLVCIHRQTGSVYSLPGNRIVDNCDLTSTVHFVSSFRRIWNI